MAVSEERRITSAFITAFYLLVFCCQLQAQSTTEKYASQFSQFSTIEGEFNQLRYISVLKLPLRSSGVFNYQKSEGMVWHTLEPIENTVKITESQGVFSGGSVKDLQLVASSPLIGQIFLGVLSGNLSKLVELFDVREQPIETGWMLLLTPRASIMSDYIDSIRLSGNEHVEAITLYEGNGDRTEISLQVTALD
ncbi:MAG: outer membrane lipoprotein carrier protein LolA [Gammaproteobacteria bacterium]|nr:outer membrane lipoprotein carrier protein LolA [Gammaproteobacteria bacterium]